MKNIIKLTLILIAFTFSAKAQSTIITPGTALPQMTSSQRTSLASPVNGMLVFDTNTQSYWFRQSGAWTELPKGGSTSNYWQLNGLAGNEIKNTNSGGIWSENATGLTWYNDDNSKPPTAPINGDGTRLMWIPNRSAFRAGTIYGGFKTWDADSIGLFSTAFGFNTKANGNYSTAMGYFTTASGYYSTAMGSFTTASNYSTAMGRFANTNNNIGSFVFGDFQNTSSNTLYSDATNRFSARFSNGYKLFTNATRTNGVMALANANSWSSISDSTKKERFLPYNPEKVLNSVAQMRIGTWNYKTDRRQNGRHWGVMAQDFYAHFGKDQYGTIGCDTLIATADFDGVSFAAIKALELRTRALQKENKQLKMALKEQAEENNTQFYALKNDIQELKALLNKANSPIAKK